jgi:hypothetical protein
MYITFLTTISSGRYPIEVCNKLHEIHGEGAKRGLLEPLHRLNITDDTASYLRTSFSQSGMNHGSKHYPKPFKVFKELRRCV